jgi:hypothetical protein
MVKLKVSIALSMAVGALAVSASAQVSAPAAGSAEAAAGKTAADAPASSVPVLAPAPAPVPANPVVPAAPQYNNPPTWVGATPTGQDGTPGAMPAYGIAVAPSEARAPEAPEPARTYEYRFTATLDVANVLWRPGGGGYRLFADNDRAWRIALGLGYDLLNLPENLTLAVEAGYLAEPSHGTEPSSMGGGLSGSLSASTLLLGSSLRWAITPWMAPYGRLGLFASRVAMDFDAAPGTGGASSSAGMSWTRHQWTAGGLLGAGVMVNMLPKTRVAVGLLVEGGLWLQKSVEMRLDNELPAGAIATTGARIGTLDNTGPYFRLAGVLRF